MSNRRNLYRILHLQPEAPLEIIKASYRSLMTKLKGHPDLGGDQESAVLINQAYAVLSDPTKRKQYDEIMHLRKSQGREDTVHAVPINTQEPFKRPRSGVYQAVWDDAQSPSITKLQRCLFCGTDLAFAPGDHDHCINCASPLTSSQLARTARLGELFDRRASLRIAKVGALVIYPSWPHAGYAARLHDLSPSGISMLTEYRACIGQILKLNSDNLTGIARVVSVRANGASLLVHASFMTAEFVTKAGFFVTEKV